MIVYKLVKSLLYIVLTGVCVSMPVCVSAGVGTEPSAGLGLPDPTSATRPLMTPPSMMPGSDDQSMPMPVMTAPSTHSGNQAIAASRSIRSYYPAPSFRTDMLLQGAKHAADAVTPPYAGFSSARQYLPQNMPPQQYTVPQYQMQPDMGGAPEYNGSTPVFPAPFGQTAQPPYPQGGFPGGMMPYGGQGMPWQMPGMEMSPYGVQPQYMSVEQIYNQARQSYKARDDQRALSAFSDVAMRFPQSDLADNAYYWMGEIYYRSKNYPEAIHAFQTVMQLYPHGNKVPDAMLKMGFAYADIGQYHVAKTILDDVSLRFSGNTRIRNLAVKKLNSLHNLY